MTGLLTFTSQSSSDVRRDALKRLASATEADAGCWYSVSPDSELQAVLGTGDASVSQILERFIGGPLPAGAASSASSETLRARRGAWTLSTVPAVMRSQFRGLYDDFKSREHFAQLPAYEQFYGPCRISDQLRLLPFYDECFLGWVGVLRTDGRVFSRAQRRAAAARVVGLRDTFAAARALDAIGDAAYLTARPSGEIEHGCGRTRRWLSDERQSFVRRAVRDADREGLYTCRVDGVELRFVRLDGPGGVRYLATLQDLPVPRLGAPSTLTTAERAVADAVAAGLRVREVAEEQALSPNTVKFHLKNVYLKLGVSTRLELREALLRPRLS
ncbi:MAG: helix-turn-helix transcriptional regulator [Polyangiaceae bacterium]|nr:helix-turn-helix transcriptional regulator [Polyangiaceae bacterium]